MLKYIFAVHTYKYLFIIVKLHKIPIVPQISTFLAFLKLNILQIIYRYFINISL